LSFPFFDLISTVFTLFHQIRCHSNIIVVSVAKQALNQGEEKKKKKKNDDEEMGDVLHTN
jgi:hypothetical protein